MPPNSDPLVDMMNAPAPSPATPAPDNGAAAAAATVPLTAVEAAPAPPPVSDPVVIPDLGPEPTIPGSDPASQQAQIIAALQRQVEMLNAKLSTPQPQPRQQPESDPVDGLFDDTPAWAKKLEQSVQALEQRTEAQRKIDEGVRRNAMIQSEMAGAANILNESAQKYQITKDHPEVHSLITNFLGGQIQAVVERNPFAHGLTKESVQTAYAQLAQQIHKTVASVIGKRQQTAAAQVQANAQTSALIGGTATPTNSGSKHTGDLLTNEAYWNKEVDILLNSAVAKVTGQ